MYTRELESSLNLLVVYDENILFRFVTLTQKDFLKTFGIIDWLTIGWFNLIFSFTRNNSGTYINNYPMLTSANNVIIMKNAAILLI